MSDALSYPEFPRCVAGNVVDGLVKLFRDDPACAGFFHEISDLAHEDDLLLEDREKSIKPPALFVTIRATGYARYASNDQSERGTLVNLLLVLPRQARGATADHLEHRVESHLVGLIERVNGEIPNPHLPNDAAGNAEVCTEGLLDVARTAPPRRLPRLPNALIHTLGVEFKSLTDAPTQEFIL